MILLFLIILIAPVSVSAVGFDDIAGDYCSVRQEPQCCHSRDDECTAPILGNHLCYCDSFCDKHPGHDCCPDYAPVCQGVSPRPKATTEAANLEETSGDCVDNAGRKHSHGQTYKYNCNECICGSKCDDTACVINTELLGKVNENGRVNWRAENYSEFWGMPLYKGVQYRLGTLYPDNSVKDMNEITIEDEVNLPEHFDAREKWPEYIHEVRDQENCGASWAFSTTNVASDRLAIQSDGRIKTSLSPQQLLSCNQAKQKGCKGGYLDRAWWYLHRLGVMNEECYPYESGKTNEIGQCHTPKESYKQKSDLRCPSGHHNNTIFKMTPAYRVSSKIDDIRTEIFMNGPVQATFVVHEDFYMYKSGIYRHLDLGRDFKPQHRKSGYHSVRVIGWGIDHSTGKPIEYWICDNSWGTWWGEDGFFKIIRGENHCEIESFVLAAWGKFGKKKRRFVRKVRRLLKA